MDLFFNFFLFYKINIVSHVLQVETDSWLENAANGLMGSQVSVT